MTTTLSRVAFAALLATTLSAGFVAFAPAASAQVSPADPNYSYDTRGKTVPWHGAIAPASHVYSQDALNARASAIGNDRGQDPDLSVRLQLLKSQGLFDR